MANPAETAECVHKLSATTFVQVSCSVCLFQKVMV